MSVRLMGTGSRIIGQSKKRSAVAALRKLTREALQGEPSLAVFRGVALSRGSESRQVLAAGLGELPVLVIMKSAGKKSPRHRPLPKFQFPGTNPFMRVALPWLKAMWPALG